MIIIQWIVWGLALFTFIALLYFYRKDTRRGKPIHEASISQLVLFCLAVIIFPFKTWNKLHLLWVIPSCFIGGLIMGFYVSMLPIVGRIWHIICCVFVTIFFWGAEPKKYGMPVSDKHFDEKGE